MLQAIDPLTGELIQDPTRGLLPPNDAQGHGAGFVSYTILPADGVATGATVHAQARVLFDNAPPEDTQALDYVVDGLPPTTTLTVTPLGPSSYRVAWNSQDEAGGSGFAHVTLYVATDGGDFKIWQRQLTDASGVRIFQAAPGHTYEFLALATDLAGNREAPPAGTVAADDGSGAHLGSLPSVPTTPANFGVAPAPTQQPSTNPLFTRAQQGIPAAPPAENASEFTAVLQPFRATSFAIGIGQSLADIGPLALAQAPDGTILVSGGAGRNLLYRLDGQGGAVGAPLYTESYPIYNLAFDGQGRLWATTGGGPLLQLDPGTGAVLHAYGDSLTVGLAVQPSTGLIYVDSGHGVEIFDPTTGQFSHYSRDLNLRFNSLAFAPDGSLWAVTWPDRREVVRFTDHARAEIMLAFDADVDSIAFGQAGTLLAGLLFVTHNSGPADGPAGSELTMVDVVTRNQVPVAQGGTRGAVVLTTSDGRVLVSQSHEVDVLDPVLPPVVVGTNPPAGGIAALPLTLLSVIYDQDMSTSDPSDPGSVLNPENYTLTGAGGSHAVIRQVTYDAASHTAFLEVDGLLPDQYTLTVSQAIKSAAGLALKTPWSSTFTAVSDFSPYVRLNFSHSRLDRQTGSVSYDVTVTNTGTYDLLLPVLLVLDPALGYQGVPQHAVGQTADGRWLVDLSLDVPGGVRLRPGESTTGQTVTVVTPGDQRVDYTAGVGALPTVNIPPVFDAPPSNAAQAGTLYRSQALAHDPDGSVVVYFLYNGPAGMSVDAQSGQITWPVPAQVPATVPVTLYVVDSRGGSTPLNVTINVAGGKAAPVLDALPTVLTIKEGELRVLRLSATEPDGSPLNYWADNLPAGATFDPATHALYWTPAAGSAGTYRGVTFHVSDGVNQVQASVEIDVAPGGLPPDLAQPASRTLREGDRLRFTLQASDAGGRKVSFSSPNLPAGATLDPNTGLFDWKPAYNQTGVYQVVLAASNGLATATRTVNVTVLNVNAAPVFDYLAGWRTFEGQNVNFVSFAFDPDNPTFVLPTLRPDGTLTPTQVPASVTYTASHLPTGATFDPITATFSWTPGYTQAGVYTVTFTATDDGNGTGDPLASTVDVTITVLNQNRAPVITPIANLSVARGQTLDVPVTVTDPDGDPLTVSASSAQPGFPLPRFATFTNNGDGTGVIHLAPGTGDRGDYTLNIHASDDGDGGGRAAVLSSNFSFVVTVTSANDPPVLPYLGDQVAVVGQAFSLPIQVSDLDQDALQYALSGLPTSAQLTPGSTYGTALLTWTPTQTDVSTYAVTITVTDSGNASDSRTIHLVVRASDSAPTLTPVSDQSVAEGASLQVLLHATDPENDPLTWTAQSLPAGASLDPATGLLSWTPTYDQAGDYPITVTAGDGSASASETFTIHVTNTNRAPQLVPMMTQYGRENALLTFTVVGADPDAETTALTVENLPPGAVFVPLTGLFRWTPSFDQSGDYTVTFHLTDPEGASDTIQVPIHIDNVDRAPTLATGNHQAVLNQLLQFTVTAHDPDSQDTLLYSAQDLPDGATLDPHTGVLQWMPCPAQAGDYVITLLVSDGQLTATQDVLIRAVASPALPHVTVELTPSFPAVPGQSVLLHAAADSLANIIGLSVTVNGQPVTLDQFGRATIIAGAPGKMSIVATATDADGLMGQTQTVLKVRDPNDHLAPTVSFDPLLMNATLTAPTSVVGTVADGNLDSWSLQIARVDSTQFTQIASGEQTIAGGTLVRLDPATLANGFYRLRLTAVDMSGRSSTVDTQIEVNSALKNVPATTTTDLTATLGGVTVTLTRSYSALEVGRDNRFGAGWRLANEDVDIQTNLPPTGREGLGVFSALRDGTRLYLTLPTGQRVGYTFAPTQTTVSGLVHYAPAWQADPGVTYQLQSVNTLLTKAGGRYYDLISGQPYNPANPFFPGGAYTLAAPDGTLYRIGKQGTIVEQVLPGGQHLYLSDGGIQAANGDIIRFVHDAQGRLTSIAGPQGQTVTYTYDQAGDLVDVVYNGTGSAGASPSPQHYAYSATGSHVLTLAAQGTSGTLFQGALAVPLGANLGGAEQFTGQTQAGNLTAGGTDVYSFHFSADEISSTLSGRVYLRIAVNATNLTLATPHVVGLAPVSVERSGGQVVALFAIEQEGLYQLEVSGATASDAGAYTLKLAVGGDVNGDGYVGGLDSGLFTPALGSQVGDSNYLAAADILGHGEVSACDLHVLEANLGFTPSTPQQAAGVLTLGLEPSSDTAPVGDNKTTLDSVTLVGTTTPFATVHLVQTGTTATAGPTGMFAFFGVSLQQGTNQFTATSTDPSGNPLQTTLSVTRLAPVVTPPLIVAALKHDTGRSNSDGITSDATVVGSITTAASIVAFSASLDGALPADVLGLLSAGQFTLTTAELVSLAGGTLGDGTHTLRLAARDQFNNLSKTFQLVFTLDTGTPAAPAAPQLPSAFDSGASNSDGITNLTSLTIHVSAAPNSLLRLTVDGTSTLQAVGSAVDFPVGPLGEGLHHFSVTAEDPAGNVSASSTVLTVQVDVTPPTQPTLGLSGGPVGDGQTSQQSIVLAGQTDPGTAVALYRGIDLVHPVLQTVSDATGHFSFTAVDVAQGANAFRAVATDLAGNPSGTGITITSTATDTSPPVILAALANDTGRSSSDAVTSDPTVTGLVHDASGVATFTASLDGSAFASVLGSLHGVAFTLARADLAALLGGTLADGAHTLRLEATDTKSTAAPVFTLSFTLDATRPLPPAQPLLLATSDSGTVGDNVTNITAPTVRVQTSAGDLVRLYVDGSLAGQTIATGSTTDFTVGPLAEGGHNVVATVEDAAGNQSVFSTPLTITIDTTPPGLPVFDVGLDWQTRPYGHSQTYLPSVGLDGHTTPNTQVTLVQTGDVTLSDASGDFEFMGVSLPDFADYTFTVHATDGAGNVSSYSHVVTRSAQLDNDLIRPYVSVSLSQSTIDAGQTVTVTLQATDNVGVADEELFVNGNPVTLDANGQASFTPTDAGIFTFHALAHDPSGNEGSADQELQVFVTGAATAPPVAAFTDPLVTPDATKALDVLGTASSDNLLRYVLEYSPQGLNEWTRFASGTQSVTDGVLGQFDPTSLKNGFYDVRLTVQDTSGNVATATKVYQADGHIKVGQFSLGLIDLSIAGVGVPVSIDRNYDSRTVDTVGDFGFGWKLQTTEATASHTGNLGDGWVQTATPIKSQGGGAGGLLGGLGGVGGLGGLPGVGGLLPGQGQGMEYSFQNLHNDLVDVNLPGGGPTQHFIMGFTGIRYFNSVGQPLSETTIFFAPLDGTTSAKLEPLTNSGDPVVDDTVEVVPAAVGTVQFIDRFTGQIWNPTRWRVTTVDGVAYVVNEANGLQSLTDNNGNTLTFTPDSITNSVGQSITIQRDSQGRITQVTDMDEKTIQYGYDAYGDLVSVTDRDGYVTRYTYDDQHHLVGIFDPLGRQGTRNEYDDQGRLARTVDALGHVTTYDHDPSSSTEKVVSPTGGVTQYKYDSFGNIIEQTDPTGAVTKRAFDASNHMLTQTIVMADGTEETTSYTYDALGDVLTTTDPLGHTTTYTYDSAGHQLTMTDPLGRVTTNTYDSRGNVTSNTDPMGNTTTYTHNGFGELTSDTDPTGATETFGYNAFGQNNSLVLTSGVNVVGQFDRRGNETLSGYLWVNPSNPADVEASYIQTAFNGDGNALSETDARGNVTGYQYDGGGNITQMTQMDGESYGYIYDLRNNQIQVQEPNGNVVRTVYDSQDRVEYETDPYVPGGPLPDGTYTLYDADGRVVQTQRLSQMRIVITSAGGMNFSAFVSAGAVLSTESQSYDAAGRVTQEVNVSGGVTKYEYDLAGRQTAVTDPTGARTQYGYDPAGQQTSMTDANGRVTQYQYDLDGQVTKTTYADGTFTAASYDPDNRMTSETDANGQTTDWQYDASGNLTAVILPAVPDPQNGNRLTRPEYDYTYDIYGDRLTIRDPLGHVTSFTYDVEHNQTSQTLPDGETSYNQYDRYERLTRHIDFNGQVTDYTYDSQNHLTKKTYSLNVAAADSGTTQATVSFGYDANGNVSSINDSRLGVESFIRDVHYQVSSDTTPQGTLTYTNDPVTGQPASIKTGYSETDYTYDVLGRVSTVTVSMVNGAVLATPEVTTYHYTPTGQIASIDLPNGVTCTYAYDTQDRLVGITDTNAAGQVLEEFDYTLGPTGLRTQEVETRRESDGSLSVRQVNWTYDALDRLTNETSVNVSGRPDAVYSTDYTYDLAGNRLSQVYASSAGTQTVTYQYNGDDQLVATQSSAGPAATYHYDANGSLVEMDVNGQVAATYTYDLANRLIGSVLYSTDAQGHAVVTTTSYTYQYSGDRASETVAVTVDGVAQPTTTMFFLNTTHSPSDYSQVVEQRDAFHHPLETFVIGSQVLGQVGSDGTAQYFLSDALWSVRGVTDAGGVLTARYDYRAFGEPLGFNPAQAVTLYLFGGEQYDPALAQYYLRARTYNPVTGQFQSRDPYEGDYEFPQTLNHYAYTANDPVNLNDPSGQQYLAWLGTRVSRYIGNDFTGAARGRRIPWRRDNYIPISSLLELFDQWSNVFWQMTPVVGLVDPIFDALGLYPGQFARLSQKPDLIDVRAMVLYEIKPGKPWKILEGYAQLLSYINTFRQRTRNPRWHAGTFPRDPYLAPRIYRDRVFGVVNIYQLPSGLIVYKNWQSEVLDEALDFVMSLLWQIALSPSPVITAAEEGEETVISINAARQFGQVLARKAASLAGDQPGAVSYQPPASVSSGPNDPAIRGKGYSIAVIDTGVNYRNPDLAGKVILGPNFGDHNDDPMDQNGHGTFIAGELVSQNPSAPGIAPDAKVIALKVTRGASSEFDVGALRSALQWVIDHRALYNIAAVNLSVAAGDVARGQDDPTLEPLFRQLAQEGVFVAAAAGNEYSPSNPGQGISILAASPEVASVGAVWAGNVGPAHFSTGASDYSTGADRVASFSQRGPGLDLLAPGGAIEGLALDGGLTVQSGTSEAAPLVAGAALLAREMADEHGLKMTPAQILDLLQRTGKRVYDGDDEDSNVPASHLWYSVLDVGAALQSLAQQVGAPEESTAQATVSTAASGWWKGVATSQTLFQSTLVTSDAPTNWQVHGSGSVVGDTITLEEDRQVNTDVSNALSISAGTVQLQFTITRAMLGADAGQPPDAFEAALLDPGTMNPLVGPVSGLSDTDAFLNIQADGEVFFGPGVSVSGVSASGQIVSLDQPLVVTVDMSGVAAHAPATLFYDLIGFGAVQSSVTIQNVRLLSAAPKITGLSGTTSLNEGDTANLSVQLEANVLNSHTAVVDWGDDTTPETVTLPAGQLSFTSKHVYGDEGNYTVTVSVTGPNGSDSGTLGVTVNNVAPSASAGQDVTLAEGQQATLHGTYTDPSTVDTHTFLWQVVSSNGQVVADATTQDFSFTPNDNGVYTVTFTVTDEDNASGSATVTVTVTNVAPTATLSNNGPIDEGSSVHVQFTNPSDPSSADVAAGFRYSFALDPSNLASSYASAASSAATDVSFDDNGSYTVYGRIFDKDGGYTDYQTTVVVNNVAPTATLQAAGTVNEGSSFSVGLVNATDPSQADTTAGFHYAFAVDGASLAGATYAGSGTASSQSFSFDDGPSDHTVTVRIFDKDGGYSDYTANIHVVNVVPTATLQAPTSVNEGSSFTVGLSSPHDPSQADTAAGFHYAFAVDGASLTGATYPNSGTASSQTFSFPDGPSSHTITERIFDKDGGFTDYTATVAIANVAPVVVLGAVQAIYENGTATLTGTISDPGVLDTFTLSVHWGDPTSPNDTQTYTFAASSSGTQSFTLTHQYLDDNPTGTPQDTYTIAAVVTDNNGDSGPQAATTVLVQNVAPTFSAGSDQTLAPPAAGHFSRALTFSDPGTLDTWTGTVDFGDGSGIQALSINQANHSFTLDHTFPNSSAAPPLDTYTVTVTVSDDDGGSHTETFHVTVNLNTPPVANNDAVTTDEDADHVDFNVLSNDTDAQNNIVASLTTNLTSPAHGVLLNNHDGTFTFKPNGAFDYLAVGEVATETFAYQITDAFGATGTATVTITIQGRNDAPSVGVTTTSVTVNEGDTAHNSGTFTDVDLSDVVSITASAGSITQDSGHAGNWSWSFGTNDGPAQAQTVTITATDRAGAHATVTFALTVQNVAPTVAINGAPASSPEGTSIALTNSVTDPSSVDTAAGFTYAWSVTKNGNAYTSGSSSGFTFTPNDNGTYVVTLAATDKDGGSTSTSKTITITNVAPSATLSSNGPINEGSAVHVQFTSPSDPSSADTAAGFHYSFALAANNLASSYASAGSGASSDISFDDNGSYTVYGRIFDKDGGYTDYQTTVVVNNVAPTATLQAAGTVNEGSSFSVGLVNATDPSQADTTAGFHYAFAVDGASLTGATYANSGTASSQTFSFPDGPSDHTVTERIFDKDGGFTNYTASIHVANVAPSNVSASFSSPLINTGNTLTLAGSFADPGTQDTHTVVIHWADGTADSSLALAAGVLTFSTTHQYINYPSGAVTVTVTDKDSGVGTFSLTAPTLEASIYVLNATASGALNLSGNGSIQVPGLVEVDSTSSSAVSASGNTSISAHAIQVAGGTQTSGHPSFVVNGQTISPSSFPHVSLPDPLANLIAPSLTRPSPLPSINLSGNSCLTIDPGVYGQIQVSGNASLTLHSGVYVLAGGGFTVSGNGSITTAAANGTTGVMIYNAGSSYPSSGGSFGSINLSGNGTINLPALTGGPYAGVVIFQARDNTKALGLSGNALSGTAGMVYAPAAAVTLSGNGKFNGTLIACTLNISGNAVANDLTSNGTTVYTPAQVRGGYGVNGLALDGTGQTIAIVDAYDNPAIYAALDAFDAQFGPGDSGPTLSELYGPAAAFLTVVNQRGQADNLPGIDPTGPGAANWEVESELDVEWAHAIAPGANIVLVEADSQSLDDLMTAVATAAGLPGVSVVSMSWGFPEGQAVLAQDEGLYDSYLTTPAGHPGVTFVASSGDYGTADLEYPAVSPNVVAVGGTSLNLSAATYQGETGWGSISAAQGGTFIGSGGGVSLYETAPAYQTRVQDTGYRSIPDVSLVADPDTGAWIADVYNLSADNPWEIVGGTSLSAPSWAGLILLANQARVAAGGATLNSASSTETQQALYNLSLADFHDVSTGSNGFDAGAGYDLVTGLGTPLADLLVPDLAGYNGASSSERTITVTGDLQRGSWAPTGSGGAAVQRPFNLFNAEVVAVPGQDDAMAGHGSAVWGQVTAAVQAAAPATTPAPSGGAAVTGLRLGAAVPVAERMPNGAQPTGPMTLPVEAAAVATPRGAVMQVVVAPAGVPAQLATGSITAAPSSGGPAPASTMPPSGPALLLMGPGTVSALEGVGSALLEGGNALLIGDRDDLLVGAQGRDLLIGGIGSTSAGGAKFGATPGRASLTDSSVHDLLFSHLAINGGDGSMTHDSVCQTEGVADPEVTDWLFQHPNEGQGEDVD